MAHDRDFSSRDCFFKHGYGRWVLACRMGVPRLERAGCGTWVLVAMDPEACVPRSLGFGFYPACSSRAMEAERTRVPSIGACRPPRVAPATWRITRFGTQMEGRRRHRAGCSASPKLQARGHGPCGPLSWANSSCERSRSAPDCRGFPSRTQPLTPCERTFLEAGCPLERCSACDGSGTALAGAAYAGITRDIWGKRRVRCLAAAGRGRGERRAGFAGRDAREARQTRCRKRPMDGPPRQNGSGQSDCLFRQQAKAPMGLMIPDARRGPRALLVAVRGRVRTPAESAGGVSAQDGGRRGERWVRGQCVCGGAQMAEGITTAVQARCRPA
ncbi:hypothetical protein C8Q78DRAFT_393024 [Trametes maxima]|nr:hypothetical protein C8Q78DRAFT_393024 [Trametes maxima]